MGGDCEGVAAVPEQPALSFAGLLRQLRAEARLTQEELAEAAGMSPRSVSDLERGVALPRKDTVRRLANALGLAGPARESFEAAARGEARAGRMIRHGSKQTTPGPPQRRLSVFGFSWFCFRAISPASVWRL